MNKSSLGNSLLLLLTAIVWGVAFVAQSVGMDYIGPFTFNSVRSVLGAVVLIPVVLVLRKKKLKACDMTRKELKAYDKNTIIGGCCCGVLLCAASNAQQMGIVYTTVGKAGFITALYVVLVPVLGLFMKKRVQWLVWISVCLSVAGLYLLCLSGGGFKLQYGDSLVLICALLFSFHILVIDHFSVKADGVTMSCIQFFVSGFISGVLMLIFEKPSLSAIMSAWLPIGYAGIFSCGVGYTLQIVGQKNVDPTVASLILCLESVVSALAGWLLLNQVLSPREMLGCVLMFTAIVLAQLPVKKRMVP